MDGSLDEAFHHEFESQLEVIVQESGIYLCKVCSLSQKTKCDQKEISVFVNDYSRNGFVIKESENYNNIFEEDEVEIVCAASKYAYTKASGLCPAWI